MKWRNVHLLPYMGTNVHLGLYFIYHMYNSE